MAHVIVVPIANALIGLGNTSLNVIFMLDLYLNANENIMKCLGKIIIQ